jgi:hypothetical protein
VRIDEAVDAGEMIDVESVVCVPGRRSAILPIPFTPLPYLSPFEIVVVAVNQSSSSICKRRMRYDRYADTLSKNSRPA